MQTDANGGYVITRSGLLVAAALVLTRHQLSSGDLDAALGAATGAALLLLAGWVLLAALAAALLRAPGALGRLGRSLLALTLPPAARLAVAGLVGAQALTGVAVAHGDGAELPSVERPLTTAVATVEPLAPTADTPPPRVVVVRPGDSLWTIAAHHLGGAASAAQVAAAWPRWYAANTEVIGPDPDLVAVGTTLVVPSGAAA
jgi:hypothetical protein